jgi:hypothetical protein
MGNLDFKLPWDGRVDMFRVNPSMASEGDVAQLAQEWYELTEENKRLNDGLDRIIKEISEEIDSRPEQLNFGKKGCLRRVRELKNN